MIADEFIKLCGLKDKALNAAQRIGRYSKGAIGDEEGMTGLNRIRQKLKGDLAKKYYDQYSSMPAGPEKEQIMRKLVDEDTSVLNSRFTAGAAGMIGASGLSYGVN